MKTPAPVAPRTLFVTGTDTGVGKTRAACALIAAARAQGIDACGYKPVASGCEQTPEGLRNDDALALLRASGGNESYAAINPLAFAPAIAPHLAARDAGLTIETVRLEVAHAQLCARHELIVVEGAGGWQVPLNETQTFADWVAARQWPVVLVVALRLGCLNHALLSAEAIQRRSPLVGWIANILPPAQARWQDNIEALRTRINAPLWGVIGDHADAGTAQQAVAVGPYRDWLAASAASDEKIRR